MAWGPGALSWEPASDVQADADRGAHEEDHPAHDDHHIPYRPGTDERRDRDRQRHKHIERIIDIQAVAADTNSPPPPTQDVNTRRFG